MNLSKSDRVMLVLSTLIICITAYLAFDDFLDRRAAAAPVILPEPKPVHGCQDCGCKEKATKPFIIACPYCRNRIQVQPNNTGDIGTVGKFSADKATK